MVENSTKQGLDISVAIIKNYAERTGYVNHDVERLKDTASSNTHKVWVFRNKTINPLGIEEERFHYLVIRKKWYDYNVWSDERKTAYGKWGIIVPLIVYEYMANKKSLHHELVICVTNDNQRFATPDRTHDNDPFSFYSISFQQMNDFVKRYYTISKTNWGDEVIGFPYSLFKRV